VVRRTSVDKDKISVATAISATIWLFGQLGLVSLLFFWPREGGFGWPRQIWSLRGKIATTAGKHELTVNLASTNLALYVFASICLLILIWSFLRWQQES
jgi:hypothetical protein